MSVTALGSRHGDAQGAAGRVVDYLDGRIPSPPGRSRDWWRDNDLEPGAVEPGATMATPGNDAVVGYYADSVEGPGIWLGRGVRHRPLRGEVSRESLLRMLCGQDPSTGDQLLDAKGSATRAQQLGRAGVDVESRGDPDEALTLSQAATLLGVSARYLRRVATRTAAARADGDPLGEVARAHPYLDAVQDGSHGHWRVSRAEVARFAAARRPPAAVIGYDLTFSVPKSVSILWARADERRRAEVVASVHAAVAAGMSYLEDNAAFVRTGPGGTPRIATGILAASYLHATSRALDPQLHCHVVVANMAKGPDGSVRALDGRFLYAHASAASHLAAAHLRRELTRRLGVEWQPVERGLADVAGVPRDAIVAMSKRAAQLDAVLPDIEAFYTQGHPVGRRGRQVAAYLTRAAKADHGVDPAALAPWWTAQLDAAGFGARELARCYNRQPTPALVTAEDRLALMTELADPNGVTEHAAVFARRDVIRHVADWAGNRLEAGEICDLTDAFLASEAVVGLERVHPEPRAGDLLHGDDRRTLPAAGEALYTTSAMLELEERLFASYQRGRSRGTGVVPVQELEAVLAERPGLGDDQVAMVASVCGSGHRVQCVLGAAGSGKTTALEAAARAWERAGYEPLGAAVQGTATEVLAEATGMRCSTVASLLARLDYHHGQGLGPRNVVVVDEASTLANRDLARLMAYVERAGATLRLVGDPAQHPAVAAGGAWRALLERYPEDRAELTQRRRQPGPELEQVRRALDDYASGKVGQAVERLRQDNRVVEADSPEEQLDRLVADWYGDRLRRQADPNLAPSSMVADHHFERAELNRRARALLAAHGELSGPSVEIEGLVFQAGDEVIALAQDRALRAPGAPSDQFVRTGERGVVAEARPGPEPAVVVDFERRGRVEVGGEYLSRQLRPGVVGALAHSYALTSHLAQGETYTAARHLGTDRSSAPGVYVGLSRGREDVALYVVRRRDLLPTPEQHPAMPRLEDDTATLAAVVARLEAQRSERLAQEADPQAAAVARLRRSHSLPALAAHAQRPGPDAALARRAYAREAAAVAARARLAPDPALVERLGPRPPGGPDREVWDEAVGAAALYRTRWEAVAVEGGPGASWALGPPSKGPAASLYQRAARALGAAEVAAVARRSPAELAAEHRQLSNDLIVGPSEDRLIRAEAALQSARQRLAEAQAARRTAARDLEELQAAPRRRRDRHGIDLARQHLTRTDQALEVAALGVRRADQEARAMAAGLEAQRPARERLAVVEAALDTQVRGAVESPAPYLTDLLGPRPSGERGRQRWENAATVIETYRHRELGLAPEAGPLLPGDEAVLAAVGPRPKDYLKSLNWDYAVRQVPGQELVVEPPAPVLVLEL